VIRRIWVRIILLLALAVVPSTLLQLSLQKDSVDIVYNLADDTGVRDVLDRYLDRLKHSAIDRPDQEASLRDEFARVVEVKRSVESLFIARSAIDDQLQLQTAIIVAAVLFVSVLGSVLISRGIVDHVHLLIADRERTMGKLRDLESLQRWQQVARTLVHELRAPLTPIQLIASDLGAKFHDLDDTQLERYLQSAQTLLSEQVRSIEAMIGSFTTFGRLPAPEFAKTSLGLQVDLFVASYRSAFGHGVSFQWDDPDNDPPVMLDAKLIRDVLFNLVKNAAEANGGETQIKLHLSSDGESVACHIANTGVSIPDSVSKSLFEPYVSTKAGGESGNMGLGLAISKKIALDHGGDLVLSNPGSDGIVEFKLTIPRMKAEL
jgi:signal transduction histidine kinase